MLLSGKKKRKERINKKINSLQDEMKLLKAMLKKDKKEKKDKKSKKKKEAKNKKSKVSHSLPPSLAPFPPFMLMKPPLAPIP